MTCSRRIVASGGWAFAAVLAAVSDADQLDAILDRALDAADWATLMSGRIQA